MKKILEPLCLKGLIKIGNIIIPGDDELPSFKDAQVHHQLERMTDFMNSDDRMGFKFLLIVIYVTPKIFLNIFLFSLSFLSKLPSGLGSIFRKISIGLRGVVFTLYYSGLDSHKTKNQQILNIMNYQTNINTNLEEDLEMENLIEHSNPVIGSKHLINNPDLFDANKVFQKASQAQTEISKLNIQEKLKIINSIKKVILGDQEKIVDIIQKETFKSRTDILLSEIFPLMEHLDFLLAYANSALREEKIPTPISMMGRSSKIWYEPMGNVLIISPWNYPFYQAIVPITCSFIAGNATIYKPSEITPLTGLVESVLSQAGIKSDWVQVIYGDGKIGSELIDQRPNKIFFTGSVNTGKKIMQQASQYLIPVELELGGKDPMIVFDDVDINRAVKGAVWGAFTNTGQSCTSVENLYVHENIYENFKKILIEEVQKIKIGVDSDATADMGGMISEKQVLTVSELVRDAISNGAKILTGSDWDFKSRFIPPIILENTTKQMRINQEEIFGPVLPLMKFKNEQEAIELANDSNFGLSASVWSNDLERAKRVSSQLITGNISINNVMLSEGNHALPFGGVKDSGIGRFKGIQGLRSFCNIKSVLVDKNSKKIEANWYPYTPRKYELFSGLIQSLFSGGIKKFIGLIRFGLPLENLAQKDRD